MEGWRERGRESEGERVGERRRERETDGQTYLWPERERRIDKDRLQTNRQR